MEGDLQAHSDRIGQLQSLANELAAANYSKANEIVALSAAASADWVKLTHLTDVRRVSLEEAMHHWEKIDEMQLSYAATAAVCFYPPSHLRNAISGIDRVVCRSSTRLSLQPKRNYWTIWESRHSLDWRHA